MSELEKKVNVIARMLLAQNAVDAENARSKLVTLMESAKTATQCEMDAEDHVREVLLDIGVPDNLIGHGYLVDGIMMAIEDPTLLNKITSSLYPAIAQNNDTTASRVERAIRHAVEVAFDRTDMDALAKYFGNTISLNRGKPVNSEFLARIANVVKMRMKHAA